MPTIRLECNNLDHAHHALDDKIHERAQMSINNTSEHLMVIDLILYCLLFDSGVTDIDKNQEEVGIDHKFLKKTPKRTCKFGLVMHRSS